MEQKIRSFRDLRVWRKGMELVKEVYQATKNFPKAEQFGLSSQMRRSAISVPSNIAEGFRRRYNKEQKQFLNISLGSCAELETQVIISRELNYINEEEERLLMELIDYTCAMIVNLDKKIQ